MSSAKLSLVVFLAFPYSRRKGFNFLSFLLSYLTILLLFVPWGYLRRYDSIFGSKTSCPMFVVNHLVRIFKFFLREKYYEATVNWPQLIRTALVLYQIIEHPRVFFYLIFIGLMISFVRKAISCQIGFTAADRSFMGRYPSAVSFRLKVAC